MQKVELALEDIVSKAQANSRDAQADSRDAQAVGRDVQAGSIGEIQSQKYNSSARQTAPGHDHVDAINQMFAEFELAYHNQYHKAYSQEGSVGLAKKYWLSCLGGFSPEMILQATRKVVTSQEYLPSIAILVQACEDTMSLFGLLQPHDAYIEACCATLPKAEYNWSHPAVYLAGKATGWFELANQAEAKILKLFEYHYHCFCLKVLAGESLEISHPKALPASGSIELSAAENKDRLAELRKSLNI